MLGHYTFVCVLFVILIVVVYVGHCCFTVIDNNVVDYDIYHCLFNMLCVLWLAIFSNLCRGGYTVVSLVPLCITIINVHNPDLILLVNMLLVAGRLATLK